MKWLAFVLLCINGAVWYVAGAMQAPLRSTDNAVGTLPRVASLKDLPGDAGTSTISDSTPLALPRAEAPAAANEPRSEVEPAVVSDDAVTVPEPETAPERAVVSETESIAAQCARIGWFENREAANVVLAAVAPPPSVSHRIESVERERPPLNWVIIPPQPREAALRQFRAIQRQGVDSYLVTRGEYRNAISLGLFESREAALSVLEEKKRQNLNVVLAKFTRNQISYALVFEAGPDAVDEVVQAVKTEFGSNFDFIEINPCEGVATAEKNP